MNLDQWMVLLMGMEAVMMTTVVPYLVFRRLISSAKRRKYRRVFAGFISEIFGIGDLNLPVGLRGMPGACPPAAPATPHPAPSAAPSPGVMATPALPTVVPPTITSRRPQPPTVQRPPAVTEPDPADGEDEGDDEAPPSKPSVQALSGSVGGDESARRRSEIAIRVELGATLIRQVIPIMPEAAAKKMARTAIRYPEMATRILCAYAAREGLEVDPQAVLDFLSQPLDQMPALPSASNEISEVG